MRSRSRLLTSFPLTLGCYFFIFFTLNLLNLSKLNAQADTVSTHVSFLFMGDIMGHDAQIESAYNKADSSYDFNPVFRYIKPYIQDADFAIANLELTLAGPPFQGYPQFSSPDELAVACKNAGIDVLVTANNHSCDKHGPGIIRTIRVMDSLNLQQTGTFTDSIDRKNRNLLILEKENISIGLLNYTYGTNGISPPLPSMVNLIDTLMMFDDIVQARGECLDHLVVFLHWGIQYEEQPNEGQELLTEFLFRNGVDVVIGSHPHVLQKMVWDQNQKKAVVYSLGNFVSNQRTFPRAGGTIVKIDFIKENSSTTIEEISYLLTWVYKPLVQSKYFFHILPCIDFEKSPEFFNNDGAYEKMMEYLDHARELLNRKNIMVNEWK